MKFETDARVLLAGFKETGAGANPPGVDGLRRRPHVHATVYFGTPAEHNRKLLESSMRALIQWIERNGASAKRATARNALYLIETIARDEGGA